MIITARLLAPQTNVGYQFYDAAGSLIASRITAGIVELPEPGSYQANSAPPANAVGVFWDCDAAGVTAQASLTTAVPTSAENATAVRTELATELARIDVAVSSVGGAEPSYDLLITAFNQTATTSTQTLLDAIANLNSPAVSAPVTTLKQPVAKTTSNTWPYGGKNC